MSASNIGAGGCPMGSSPCGFGVPGSIASSYPTVLRKVDASIGSSVALDPKTGDYVIGDTGQRVGSDPVPPMVLLALRTIKGSAAVLDLGIGEFPKMLDDDVGARLRALVDDALSNLVTAGLVEVVEVTTGRAGTSSAALAVSWRDLSSGQVQTTFV